MDDYIPDKNHLRHVLLFIYHRQGDNKSPAEALQEINQAYGEGKIGIATIKRWYAKFREGDFSLEDQQGIGARHEESFEDAEVEELLEEYPFITQEEIARELGVTQQAVSKRMHRMGKTLKNGRLVPKNLTDAQKQARVNACNALLERFNERNFLDELVVADEKWCFWGKQERRKAWVSPGQELPTTSRQTRMTQNKRHLCLWYDRWDVIYWEMLRPGQNINHMRYIEQLEETNQAFRRRPRRRQHPIILLHDNAWPHIKEETRNFITQLGWEVLPHPANSPDLNPVDFSFNRLGFNLIISSSF